MQCGAALGHIGRRFGLWNAAQFGPNVAVSADVPTAGTAAGSLRIYLRLADPGVESATDGYFCVFNPSDVSPLIEVRRIDNSVSSSALGSSTSFNIDSGHKIGCEAIGGTIKAWVDVVSGWQEAVSVNDATYSSAGYVGLFANSSSHHMDNFGAQTISASTGCRGCAPIISHEAYSLRLAGENDSAGSSLSNTPLPWMGFLALPAAKVFPAWKKDAFADYWSRG